MIEWLKMGAAMAAVSVVCALSGLPAEAKISKELKEELQPRVEQGLKVDDPIVKAFAILAAGQLGDKGLDKELLPYLESVNTDVRRAAIVALAASKDKKALAALDLEITKAGSGADFVAAELLVRLPEGVQAQIIKGWLSNKKADALLRQAGLGYAARFGRGEVYKLMAGVASAKSDADRELYLKPLLSYPRKEAAEFSRKLLADKRNAGARLAGLKLAMAIGGAEVDPIIRGALSDADPRVASIALDYLSEAGDGSAVEFLVKKFTTTAEVQAVGERLLATGQKIPLDVAKKALDQANPDDMPLSEVLYGLYGASQDKTVIDALIAQEQATQIIDRRLAVAGLGATRSPEAAKVLERTLFDGHREVRLLSARGLGSLGFDSSVALLDKAFRGANEDKELKYLIVEAFGHIKSASSAQKLSFLIRDRDPKIKDLALDGIARINDKQAIESLRAVVSLEPDPAMKLKAALIILDVDPKEALTQFGAILHRPPEGYMDLITALPSSKRDQVLSLMLNFEKQNVRQDAIDALLVLGDAGLPLLRKAAAGNGFPPDVRTAAIEDLARHSDDADVNLFKSLSQSGSDDEKMLAINWLTRKADSSLSGFFRTLMNGSKDNASRQMAAIYALLKAEA